MKNNFYVKSGYIHNIRVIIKKHALSCYYAIKRQISTKLIGENMFCMKAHQLSIVLPSKSRLVQLRIYTCYTKISRFFPWCYMLFFQNDLLLVICTIQMLWFYSIFILCHGGQETITKSIVKVETGIVTLISHRLSPLLKNCKE